MIRSSKSKRRSPISHSALGIALALGSVAGVAITATPALAAKKVSMSKGFAEAARPLSAAIEAAKTRSDVVQAKEAVTAAQQQNNAAAATSAEANLSRALSNEMQLLE